MKHRSRHRATVVAGISLCLVAAVLAQAETPPASPKPVKKGAVMSHAAGPFEVKLVPQAPEESAGGAAVGRMTIDKQYHGDLEAVGKGQMLASTTAVPGSAGYVAMEQVSGTLHGRRGTFVLQRTGTMTRGVPQLSVTVVPDSGTGQLAGLAGRMDIKIAEGGKHSYDLECSLPDLP